MNKVVRDGKVAVVHTNDHGAGWYSWNQIEEFLFDPTLVKMIEDKCDIEAITLYLSYQPWVGNGFINCENLTVSYVPQGLEFVVLEYDGLESIVVKNEITWTTA